MKTIKLFFVALILLGWSLNGMAQYLSGELYLTVDDFEAIPTKVKGGWALEDDDLQDLFDEFDLVSFTQAFPAIEEFSLGSRFGLDSVYHVSCDCDETVLAHYLDSIFPQYYSGIEQIPENIPTATPNDYHLQDGSNGATWSLDLIEAEDAWNITTGNSDISVAIIEAGGSSNTLDLAHEEIVGKVVYTNSTNPPGLPHGTFVTGCAVGATNNSAGKSAIGYNSSIIYYAGSSYNNFVDAANKGARVINASFISCGYSTYNQGLVNTVAARGVIICAGAGNGVHPPGSTDSNGNDISGQNRASCGTAGNGIGYPAGYDNVISVTSVGSDNKHLDFTENSYHTSNSAVDVCAPGYRVLSIFPGNGYGRSSGTSFASPITAGLVALMLDVNPCLMHDDIMEIFSQTSDAVSDAASYPGALGFGRINAHQAVLAAQTYGDVAAITSNTTWAGDRYVKGTVTVQSGTLTITGTVRMAKDAVIKVQSGAALVVDGGTISSSSGCNEMWDGIEAANGSIIIIKNDALIEDALAGLDLEYGAAYLIEDAIFNKNLTHLSIHMPSSGTPSWTGDYRIKRSRFLCQTTASIPLATPVHTNLLPPHQTERSDLAILALGVPKILLGSSSAADANEVDNCDWGMFNWTVDRIEVLHNTFQEIGNGGVYCAYGAGNGGETIDINNNVFNKMPYPIFCYDNTPTVRTHIESNTIDFAGMVSPPQTMTGITYQEITAASGYDPINPSNSEYNYVDINDNDILNAPCGIQLINLTGDQTAPTAKLYVGENYITHTKIPNDGQAGIKTANVRKGVFKANEVKHPSNNVNWWETGIRLSDGYGNALTCNNTHHVGRGIFLDGYQTPDTRLIQNIMEANQIGLFLNWSVIGAQGGIWDPRDNQWAGTSWSSSDPNTHVEGTDGDDSKFYVRSSSPYNPQYNNFGGGGIPLTITTTSGSWSGGCIYTSGASFKTDGDLDDGTQDLSALLQSQEPESEREQSLQYSARYSMYDRLVSDVELATANPEFESFVSNHAPANIGKLRQMVTGFRSSSANSAELENGMTVLQALQPENLVEQTLKEVFSILYENAPDLSSMDGDGEKRLREIAQLCPLDYGFGVFTARATLLKIDTLPENYLSECERVPSPEQMSEKRGQEDSGITFNLYPNPNNGSFNLSYKLNEGGTGTVEVFSAFGQLVHSAVLRPNSQLQNIELRNPPAGIYQARVSVNGDVRLSSKLVILK
jgi:hypothetical protein